jgi:hypothetical protein
MSEIIYETESATFRFDSEDVMQRLQFMASHQRVEEAAKLLKQLTPALPLDRIKINEGQDYFSYVSLCLIKTKGSVHCKACRKTYRPNQLKFSKLGFGPNPMEIDFKPKGGVKKLFKKKQVPMIGGKELKCPKGHELLGKITWRT